jgi:hypothetical protein
VAGSGTTKRARSEASREPPAQTPLTRVHVLEPGECRRARDAVFALRHRWVSRSREAPAFTLGASAGNVEGGQPRVYRERATRDNPILAETFGWLYERLAARLSAVLAETVRSTPHFGLPGFVVYLGANPTPTARPPIHYDCQYRQLAWETHHSAVGLDSAISLTLPISLPPRPGCGLYWWDLPLESAIERGLCTSVSFPPRSAFAGLERHFHPYRLGEATLHGAHVPHQAAFPDELREGEERISLQVHTLVCDGVRWLYF